jgi:hypothetical protein
MKKVWTPNRKSMCNKSLDCKTGNLNILGNSIIPYCPFVYNILSLICRSSISEKPILVNCVSQTCNIAQELQNEKAKNYEKKQKTHKEPSNLYKSLILKDNLKLNKKAKSEKDSSSFKTIEPMKFYIKYKHQLLKGIKVYYLSKL